MKSLIYLYLFSCERRIFINILNHLERFIDIDIEVNV